jgi:hypothetical protein
VAQGVGLDLLAEDDRHRGEQQRHAQGLDQRGAPPMPPGAKWPSSSSVSAAAGMLPVARRR